MIEEVHSMASRDFTLVGSLVILVGAASLVTGAQADILAVPRDYPTIQTAIEAAADGDEVQVAPGLYPEHLDLRGKQILLRAVGGASQTIVIPQSGQALPLVTCATGETASTVIDGFQFFGGKTSAVAVTSASPVFRSCRFTQNESTNGAAISFIGAGGLLRVVQCEFFGNSASSGGAFRLSATGGHAVFEDCLFDSNEANGGQGGGAIQVSSAASIAISRCLFRDNWASSSGGAIRLSASAVAGATIEDCGFERNGCASSGGAISIDGPASASMIATSFDSNFVASGGSCFGGAIFASGALAIEQCEFRTNEVILSNSCCNCSGASAFGGAISASAACSIEQSTFVGNRAEAGSLCGSSLRASGGAVYLSGNAARSVAGCQFLGNVADSSPSGVEAFGGAVCIDGGAAAEIVNCSFSEDQANGTAAGRGGAVWFGAASGTLRSSEFASTQATSDGGGLFLANGGAPTIENCRFSNCMTTGTSGRGGAVCCSGGQAVFSECRLTGNSSASGGAMYSASARPFIERCTLDSNTAPSGSAIRSTGTAMDFVPSIQFSDFCGDEELIVGLWSDPVASSNTFESSCSVDCNGNGVVDSVDIDRGYEGDCDGEGTPDSCQIAQGAPDLNGDGVLDSCDPVDFAGLRTVIIPIVSRSLDSTIPARAICFRIYAEFVGTAGEVWGIYGNEESPMSISVSGGFYNALQTGDLSSTIPCDLASSPHGVRYDSWLTIGAECLEDNTLQSIGFEPVDFSASGIFDDDAIVFVSPGATQAIAGKPRRVLLAQLTTLDGQLPSGTLNLVGRGSNGDDFVRLGQSWPAPELVDCDGNGVHDAFDLRDGTFSDCDENGIPDRCDAASALEDCNANGISDYCDISTGASVDQNRNNVPDECECEGDVDGDGTVNVDDVVAVILAWGDVGPNPADLNGDFVVDAGDLTLILTYYGTCQ
jgi:hypothetical protein